MKRPPRVPPRGEIVSPAFISGCCIAFGTTVVGSFILFIAAPRPVHAGAFVGSYGMGFMLSVAGTLFVRLALADSKRQDH